MKKLIPLMLIALLFTACSTPAPNAAPKVTQKALEMPVPTIVPTKAPAPKSSPTPTLNPMQEKLNIAPEIDGLYKDIQITDGIEKVVYLYDGGNPYGGEKGDYAGEFRTGIEFELHFKSEAHENYKDEDVTGVVLKPNVVKGFIIEKNSNYDYYCPIPLDISCLEDDKHLYVSYNFGEYGGIQSISVNFDGNLPLVSIGFGKEHIDQNYILGNYHGPDRLCLWDEILRDLSNVIGPDRHVFTEIKSRLFNFEGGLLIDTSLLKDDGELNLIVGQFNYGEVICEVNGNLNIFSFNEFTSPFYVGYPVGSLVFVCEN